MNPAAKTVPGQVPIPTSKMKRIDFIDQELSPTPDLPPLSPPNSPPCSPGLSPKSSNTIIITTTTISAASLLQMETKLE
ncbi:unnamed protein product [Ambrosiozyma monospora]|uniref:Unnamed protein product n=1 Tax=Ambrosiozyma monospora TaxID=43982 RepID=A0A9W6YV47_AMBMO|nr:unnamed protein product [Ambrosiozyma monospora]